MDPTASFVVTARDETAAAIKSANQNLQSLQKTARDLKQSARDLKQLFSSFGVVFGARAFVGWIEGALSAVKVTEDTSQAIKDAKKSLDDMESASTALALNLSTSLRPAMELITSTLTGWNRIIFNADPFPFEREIEDLNDKIRGVQAEAIADARQFGDLTAKLTEEQQQRIAGYLQQIEELKKKQAGALGGRELLNAQSFQKTTAVMDSFFAKYGKMEVAVTPKVELEPLTDAKSEWERQIDALMVDIPPVTLKLEPIPDFQPFKAAAKDLGDDFEDVGKSLGRGLHDSLVDFIVDGEFRFKEFLKRLAAEVAVSGLFDSISAGAGSTSFIGKMFGGFKAEGGPLNQGKWYVAGEHGPEPIWGGGPGAFAMGYSGAGLGGVHVQIEQHFNSDLTPDRAMTMGQTIAQSVYEAVKRRLGNTR